jgi:hypothetical protein
LGASPGARYTAAAAIALTAAIGYPLMFTADRGNIEGVAWALSAAGLCFLLRANYRAAALLIGLAASIKPLTILFLLLLLGRRKYKDAVIGVATTGLMVLIALMVLGRPNPWRAYQDLKPGVLLYMDDYILNPKPYDEARFDHSLLDGLKSAALVIEMKGVHPRRAVAEVPRLRDEAGGWPTARALAHVYPFLALASLAALIAFFYKMPLLNQTTAVGAAVAVLPPSAGDYTLLHLYVPFGALVVFLARDVATGRTTLRYSSMIAFGMIYGLLFAPLTFLALYAGDAKLLLLLALVFLAARSPMNSPYFEDLASGSRVGAI